MTDIDSIVEAVKSVLPKRRPIEHHEPFYDLNKASALLHRSLIIGPNIRYFTDDFETALSVRTGADHVLAVSSGTAALHIALMAAGIKPGEEVLVPSSTFVATANAVVHAGAIPHFFDCGISISPEELREYLRYSKHKIKAIVPVHLFGIPTDTKDIITVAKEFDITVIEDAAQAFGSRIDGQHVGTFGKAGILSFNHNKIITTGGGGAILSNDRDLIERAEKLATTHRIKHSWLIEHDAIGWNYRISEFQAAFGLSQLEFFDEILERKKRLYCKYFNSLTPLGVEIVESDEWLNPNCWLTVIFIDNRDELLTKLHKEGIRARASFTPLHLLPMFKNNPRSSKEMLRSICMFERAVCLPSGAGLVQ